jgi:HSP20 family protein
VSLIWIVPLGQFQELVWRLADHDGIMASQTDQALTVVLEMPGVNKGSVDVRVENDALSVEGRVDFSNYVGLQPVYTEYNVGNYARSFQLSSKIEQGAIRAELKDGVMTLVLPKSEKAKARKITVT